MPVPKLTAIASLFLKKLIIFTDYIKAQMWAFSLVLPLNIVEVVVLHPSHVR